MEEDGQRRTAEGNSRPPQQLASPAHSNRPSDAFVQVGHSLLCPAPATSHLVLYTN